MYLILGLWSGIFLTNCISPERGDMCLATRRRGVKMRPVGALCVTRSPRFGLRTNAHVILVCLVCLHMAPTHVALTGLIG